MNDTLTISAPRSHHYVSKPLAINRLHNVIRCDSKRKSDADIVCESRSRFVGKLVTYLDHSKGRKSDCDSDVHASEPPSDQVTYCVSPWLTWNELWHKFSIHLSSARFNGSLQWRVDQTWSGYVRPKCRICLVLTRLNSKEIGALVHAGCESPVLTLKRKINFKNVVEWLFLTS